MGLGRIRVQAKGLGYGIGVTGTDQGLEFGIRVESLGLGEYILCDTCLGLGQR